jgi:type III restriction enzyme
VPEEPVVKRTCVFIDGQNLYWAARHAFGYLTNRLEVKKSVYDAVVYDSEIERKFAEELDGREDIKLFVKLPGWFKVETPIGEYNPDWAILKHDDTVLYLVRETKGTKDFEKPPAF